MSRIFSYKDGMKRKRLSNKAAKFEEAMNKFIKKAYEADCPPDVSIWVTPDGHIPVIKIWFFRDSDSIQNE